jgi:hypothetical protein
MNKHNISNDRLAQIATEPAAKLPELIAERERDILKDYHDAVELAHEEASDKLPKLKLAFSMEYDLSTQGLTVAVKWTVQRKISDTIQIEDPAQTTMKLEVVK